MARTGRTGHPLIGSARRRLRLVNRLRNQAVTGGTHEAQLPTQAERLAQVLPENSDSMKAVRSWLDGSVPATWVFTGDSITHGALYTEGRRSFVEHFAERVRWELRRFDDVVINTGVCGERTGGLLDHLERRVLRFQPDVVLVLLGMNDCLAGPDGREQFRRNLEEIAGRIREGAAIPVLQTPNTVYPPNAISRSDLPAYVDIVRDVAARNELPLIDHWRFWQESRVAPAALVEWLQDASIHPNSVGHREMACLIFRALEIFDPASLTCAPEAR